MTGHPPRPTAPDASDPSGAQQPAPATPPKGEVSRSTCISDEFLPYLSSLEAAKNRRGKTSSRLLLLAVCGVFFCLLFWAAFADLEEIVSGAGQVIPSQRVQHIQNLEGGILRELLVREGQQVDKGELLLRIDNEQAGSSHRDAMNKSRELAAVIARLEAELSGGEPQYPKELLQQAPELIARHNALLEAKRHKTATEIKTLEAQRDFRLLDEKEQTARRGTLNASLALAERQRDLARQLMATRSYSEMEYLNLEQRVSALKGDLEVLETTIPKTRAAVREIDERLLFARASSTSENTAELNRINAELATLREILTAGGDRVTRTEVRSPVRGIIKSINVTTGGGVIMPGEVIMDVVPIEDSLIIEARVNPQDIAFLLVGQKAKIQLAPYDYTIYGTLDAELAHISADTIEGKRGEIYYLVKLRTLATELTHNGKTYPILPGMPATADIITGKKTVLDYIIKPILKARQTAMRER